MPTPTWAGPDRCPGASRWAELEGKGGLRRGAREGQGIRWHLSSCIIIAMALIKNQSLPNEPPATTVLPPHPSAFLPVQEIGRLGDSGESATGERRDANGRGRGRMEMEGRAGRGRGRDRDVQKGKGQMKSEQWVKGPREGKDSHKKIETRGERNFKITTINRG